MEQLDLNTARGEDEITGLIASASNFHSFFLKLDWFRSVALSLVLLVLQK